jgi:hypothetical protein
VQRMSRADQARTQGQALVPISSLNAGILADNNQRFVAEVAAIELWLWDRHPCLSNHKLEAYATKTNTRESDFPLAGVVIGYSEARRRPSQWRNRSHREMQSASSRPSFSSAITRDGSKLRFQLATIPSAGFVRALSVIAGQWDVRT